MSDDGLRRVKARLQGLRSLVELRRVPWRVVVSGLVFAWIASAFVDPVYMLDRTAVQLARLLTVAVIVGAGYAAVEIFRSAELSLIALLRVGSLLAIAAYIWLRVGVTPGVPPMGFVLPSLALFLTTGAALQIGLSASARERISRLRRQPDRRATTGLLAAASLMAALIAAPILARNWDASGWMDSRSYDSFAMNILTGRVPEGNSQYMPVYQYGLAFIYYVFGHFYFAQQFVNVVLAAGSVVALSLAAWILFESVTAMVVAAIVAALCQPFYYAVFFTQIESWYVPFICFLMLAWARYWRAPTWPRLAWLAGTIMLGINTRNQGAVFFAFMCTAPLWAPGLPWRRRWAQLAGIGALVALSLVPWTVRNYLVEGRLSPSGSRSAVYVGVLNDRRVGLYGIRYWEGWGDVVAEFEKRYTDPAERERAYLRAAWVNVASDPEWLGRAVLWRTAAFYGLLPNGMLDLTRIVPTDWAQEWSSYIFWRTTPLLLLPLSLLGAFWRRDRISFFLVGGIVSNLAILIFSASSEDRLSYPLLPMHILLAAGIFADRTPLVAIGPTVRLRRSTWIAVGVAVVLFLAACRVLVGSRHTYRTLMERGVSVVPSIEIDDSLPTLNDHVRSAAVASDQLNVGHRVRFRAMVSNYMVPPKFAGAVPWLPRFATEPLRETYFYAYLLDVAFPGNAGEGIGVTFLGARLNERIREGDAADIEGVLVHVPTAQTPGYFVRAEVVRRVPIDSSLPPFP